MHCSGLVKHEMSRRRAEPDRHWRQYSIWIARAFPESWFFMDQRFKNETLDAIKRAEDTYITQGNRKDVCEQCRNWRYIIEQNDKEKYTQRYILDDRTGMKSAVLIFKTDPVWRIENLRQIISDRHDTSSVFSVRWDTTWDWVFLNSRVNVYIALHHKHVEWVVPTPEQGVLIDYGEKFLHAKWDGRARDFFFKNDRISRVYAYKIENFTRYIVNTCTNTCREVIIVPGTTIWR